jgi:flagellar motor switch protein FliM
MRFLEFSAATITNGRRIREVRLQERSMLPISAVCVVANGIRESLSRLLATPVVVRLSEPMLPDSRAWNAIEENARVFKSHGTRSDGALVLRAPDALAIAESAFGEPGGTARSLSGIESTVLERIVSAIVPNLAPVIGPEIEEANAIDGVAGFTTYFEVLVERPVHARIGVAISREPKTEASPGLQLEDLLDVEVDVSVRTEGERIPAGLLAGLETGAFVPIPSVKVSTGVAYLAGSPLCRGECGVMGGHYAFAAGPSATAEGSNSPSL